MSGAIAAATKPRPSTNPEPTYARRTPNAWRMGLALAEPMIAPTENNENAQL